MSVEEELDIFDWIKIVEEEINVNSDRSLIITIAAILDTQLEALLKKFMKNDKKIDEKIFNNNAPLSTFSSKISMCYYLGLISKYDYDTLDIIRKIRNIFAHEIRIKKIEDSDRVKDLCCLLTIPENIYIPDSFFAYTTENMPDSFEKISLKERIIRVFKNLTFYLKYRIIDVFEEKREEYYNLAFVDVLQSLLEKVKKNSEERYTLNKIHKELLLDELKETNLDDKIREKILNKLHDIEEFIEAYDNGNIFFGLDIEDTEKVKDALKSIDMQIKKMKDNK